MALSITNLKKGTIFQMDGIPYRVVDYSQKVMGRGGSIVNVRIKSLLDGKVLDKTFKGNEQIDNADVSNKPVQYLYNEAGQYYFIKPAISKKATKWLHNFLTARLLILNCLKMFH
jgi:elongation factor P